MSTIFIRAVDKFATKSLLCLTRTNFSLAVAYNFPVPSVLLKLDEETSIVSVKRQLFM